MTNNSSTKVSYSRCDNYQAATVATALRQLLAPIGGLEAFVKPTSRVLVKPNLLTDRPPEDAVTTHPEVLRQVLRLLKEIGADITVADSPAFASHVEQVWHTTGIQAVCQEERVPLRRMETGTITTLTRNGFTFAVSDLALRADIIINLPKVKSHSLTVLTAAVKNFYGVVPGHLKTQLHKTYAHPTKFGQLVKTVCQAMPPSLTIADGVVGMEGDGPSAGMPVPLRFLAASADPFAMDLALCDVLRINAERVPYLAGLSRLPAYTSLALVGERPEIERFRLPHHAQQIALSLIPTPVAHLVGKFIWFRPSFSTACVRCGKCVTACPMDALALPAGKGRPQLKPRLCIGCCCCHEVCPARAVTIRPSPLVRLYQMPSTAFKKRRHQSTTPVATSQKPTTTN